MDGDKEVSEKTWQQSVKHWCRERYWQVGHGDVTDENNRLKYHHQEIDFTLRAIRSKKSRRIQLPGCYRTENIIYRDGTEDDARIWTQKWKIFWFWWFVWKPDWTWFTAFIAQTLNCVWPLNCVFCGFLEASKLQSTDFTQPIKNWIKCSRERKRVVKSDVNWSLISPAGVRTRVPAVWLLLSVLIIRVAISIKSFSSFTS